MHKTLLFNKIKSFKFFKGFLPFYTKKSMLQPVSVLAQDKKMVWRTSYFDTLKISPAYRDKPMELANFLFIRTREREMMMNRIENTKQAVRMANFYTTGSDPKYLSQINDDLQNAFESLREMLVILKEKEDYNLPVAFACNVLYSLEKNGLRNEEMYNQIIYPLLQEKSDYIHAEGLAHSIWALGQIGNVDSGLVQKLLEQYKNKKLGSEIEFVDNTKFSIDSYTSDSGTHAFETDSTPEFKKLYFKDHISCLELYHGLKNLSNQSLESSASGLVSEILSDLGSKHLITDDTYSYYKQIINYTHYADARKRESASISLTNNH